MLAISHTDIMYPLYDVMRRPIPLCGGLSQNPDPNQNVRKTSEQLKLRDILQNTLQNCQGHEIPSQNSNAGEVMIQCNVGSGLESWNRKKGH